MLIGEIFHRQKRGRDVKRVNIKIVTDVFLLTDTNHQLTCLDFNITKCPS